MLAGLETIDSGQIIYENEEIPLDQMESRNLLGFVFQDFQLFPHLTVLDNLTLSPIKTMGMSKEDAQKKAQALLDRLGWELTEMLILTLFLGDKNNVLHLRVL